MKIVRVGVMNNFNFTDKETEQLKKIFIEGIENKELTPKSLDFVDSLIVFERGLTLLKMTQEHFDVNSLCKVFIDNLFDLIEERNDK